MTAYLVRYEQGAYSAAFPLDYSVKTIPQNWKPGSRNIIICCHGNGGGALQYLPQAYSGFGIAGHADYLAKAGYCLLALDHTGGTSWGDPDTMKSIDDAYNYAVNTLGAPGGKVGLLGWSMGGFTVLNWAKRNKANIKAAYVFAPATDLDYFHNTAGYTPAYGGTPPTAYQAQIDTTYAASTTATSTVTIPASNGTPVTLPLTSAISFSDANGYAITGKPTAVAPGGTITYTGKTDTSLTGVLSTAGSFSIASGATITGAYANTSIGYKIRNEYASWQTLGFPLTIAHATNDGTVPFAQTQAFVNGANSSDITLKTLAAGDHTGLFSGVSEAEFVNFYNTAFGSNLPVNRTWDTIYSRTWDQLGLATWESA